MGEVMGWDELKTSQEMGGVAGRKTSQSRIMQVKAGGSRRNSSRRNSRRNSLRLSFSIGSGSNQARLMRQATKLWGEEAEQPCSRAVSPALEEPEDEQIDRTSVAHLRTNGELKRVLTSAAQKLGKLKVTAKRHVERDAGLRRANGGNIPSDPRAVASAFKAQGEARRRSLNEQQQPVSECNEQQPPVSDLASNRDVVTEAAAEAPCEGVPQRRKQRRNSDGYAAAPRMHRLSVQRSLPAEDPPHSPRTSRVAPSTDEAEANLALAAAPNPVVDSTTTLGPPRSAFPLPSSRRR
jgi:hypothetical protein